VEGLEVAAAKKAASGGRAARGTDGRRESQRDGCPLPASVLIIIFFKKYFFKFLILRLLMVIYTVICRIAQRIVSPKVLLTAIRAQDLPYGRQAR
jgi:hypothetical protein